MAPWESVPTAEESIGMISEMYLFHNWLSITKLSYLQLDRGLGETTLGFTLCHSFGDHRCVAYVCPLRKGSSGFVFYAVLLAV